MTVKVCSWLNVKVCSCLVCDWLVCTVKWLSARQTAWNPVGVEPIHWKPADINPGSLTWVTKRIALYFRANGTNQPKGEYGVDNLLPRSFLGGEDLTHGKSLRKVLTYWESARYSMRLWFVTQCDNLLVTHCEKKHCPYEKLLVIQRVSNPSTVEPTGLQDLFWGLPCNGFDRPLLRSALDSADLFWGPPCNTLQHTATHFNTLQHIATHCDTLQCERTIRSWFNVKVCSRLQSRRRSDLNEFTTAKVSNKFSREPRTFQTHFHGSPQNSPKFSRE